MNNLEYVIKKYVVNNYGDLIIPGKAVFDDKTKVWAVQLGSTYPIITNDSVKFLEFEGLGTIRLNDKLEIIDATPSEKCDEELESRLRSDSLNLS